MDADEASIAVHDAARVHRDADLRVGDLARTGTPTELRGELDDLRQTGGAERMAATDQTAASPRLDSTGRVSTAVTMARRAVNPRGRLPRRGYEHCFIEEEGVHSRLHLHQAIRGVPLG